jgi:hypothetical protein
LLPAQLCCKNGPMLQPPRPKPVVNNLARTVKTALQSKPFVPLTPAAQAAAAAARDRVKETLRKIQSSPLTSTPIGQAFQQFLQDRIANGGDIEDLLDELRVRAREELEKRRHIVACLSDALNLLRNPDLQKQIEREVIEAARTGRLRGSEAWDRVSRILGTPSPFLTWLEHRIGTFTVGMCLQAKGGMAVGGGVAEGISGLRHCLACHFRQYSVAAGAIAGADFGAQLSVSPGKPASGPSFTVEVGGGGGYGATGGGSVAFTPEPRRPTLEDPRVFDYEFAGIAVSLGGGGGLDVSLAFGVTISTILTGPPT